MLHRAPPAAGSWLTRLGHRVSDFYTIGAFSMSGNSSTSLRVGPAVLSLQQWAGPKVGSGGYLWGGSRRMCDYLESNGDGNPVSATGRTRGPGVPGSTMPLQGLRLLELGAGTGGLGLAAAVLGANVTITDQASFAFPNNGNYEVGARPKRTLLDLAQANVNQNLLMIPSTAPAVCEMLWGERASMRSLPHARYDVICGGDILLFTSAHEALVRTLRHLSCPNTVVLIEHTDRDNDDTEYPKDMCDFLQTIREDGLWQPTVVRDHGRHLTIRMVYRENAEEAE